MNKEIRMHVSSITRTETNKRIFVLFTDENIQVEFEFPECRVINNVGFSDEDINQLIQYMKAESDTIYSAAKTVNPLKGFMS